MAHSIKLTNPVGNKQIDQILQGVIGVFERVFPNRIRGYYVIGSYANQTAVSTSDIDLCPLFKDAFLNDAECEKAWQVGWLCGDFISPVQVQAEPNDEKTLFNTPDTTAMKLASLLIYGEDIRPKLSLPSPEDYTRDAMLQPIWFHYRIRKPDILTYPLTYPNIDDPYFGYVCRWMTSADGFSGDGTKELIQVTGLAARAIIVQKTKQYITSKKETFTLYREHIHDEWTDLLEDIYYKCRLEWAYKVPEKQKDQDHLRNICERVLAFENHFLDHYKIYVQQELEAISSNNRNATPRFVRILSRIIFPDLKPQMENVLESLSQSTKAELQQTASDTLAKLRTIS